MTASAPPIVGNVGILQSGGTLAPTGAFYSTHTNYPAAGANVMWVPEIHGIDASLCSSIYGTSSTITPQSIMVIFMIRF